MSRQFWQESLWWATADGTAVANTIKNTLIYQPAEGDLDIVGPWTFQAYIEIGGKIGYGSIATQQIHKPIL